MPKEAIKIKIALLLLLVLTAVVFLPSLNNGFVNWDDDGYVFSNPLIRSFSFQNVQAIFTSFFSGHYQPVTILTYMLDYRFFGLNPFGYHLSSLLWHLANSLLVFGFIYRLSRKAPVALLTAVLFGIHPLHVESVAWASARKDLVYGFFFLASLISYLVYLERPARYKIAYASAVACFVFSFLSKSMAASLPLVLFLFDGYLSKKKNKGMFLEKVPFLALLFIFSALAVVALYVSDAGKQREVFHAGQNILVACFALAFYMVKIFDPSRLSCLYPAVFTPQPPAFYLFLASAVFVAGLGTGLFLLRKFSKKLVFGFLFFFVTLLPVLQVVPFNSALVADRYTYIPSIGIFYILSEGFFWFFNRPDRFRAVIRSFSLMGLAGVLILLGFLTWQRCGVWKNDATLWSDVVAKGFASAIAHTKLGAAYQIQGDLDRAISNYTRSIEIDPRYALAYSDRGGAYILKGDFDKAIADCTEALRVDPRFAQAYCNRGVAYGQKGNADQAISDFTAAIALDPHNAAALHNRAAAYRAKGR